MNRPLSSSMPGISEGNGQSVGTNFAFTEKVRKLMDDYEEQAAIARKGRVVTRKMRGQQLKAVFRNRLYVLIDDLAATQNSNTGGGDE